MEGLDHSRCRPRWRQEKVDATQKQQDIEQDRTPDHCILQLDQTRPNTDGSCEGIAHGDCDQDCSNGDGVLGLARKPDDKANLQERSSELASLHLVVCLSGHSVLLKR